MADEITPNTLKTNPTPPQSHLSSKTVELGKKLKTAREKKGLSITNISEQFFITPDIVHKIECGKYKREDLTIFLRGYIRHYANFVCVPESEVNAVFKSLNWQPINLSQNQCGKIDDTVCVNFIGGKQEGKSHLIALIILIVFIAAVITWHMFHNDHETVLTSEVNSPSQQLESQSVLQQNILPKPQEQKKPETAPVNTQPEIKANTLDTASAASSPKTITNESIKNDVNQPIPKPLPVTPALKTDANSLSEADSTTPAPLANKSSQETTDQPNNQTETPETSATNTTSMIKQETDQQQAQKPIQSNDDSIAGMPWRTNA